MAAAKYGFQGIEIAPFTLFSDPLTVTEQELQEIKTVLQSEGLVCVGFHWLLKFPNGLCLLDSKDDIRKNAWKRLFALADQCAYLGGKLLVLGSGDQRSYTGYTNAEAKEVFLSELEQFIPCLEKNGVTLLLEPLPRNRTNFLNTLKEVDSILKKASSSHVATIFDFHNTQEESKPWNVLFRQYASTIRHIHFNSPSGGLPFCITDSYYATFRAIKESGYKEWISIETFQKEYNPEAFLLKAKKLLDELEAQLL